MKYILIALAVLVIYLKTFVYDVVYIPSESMFPSLSPGDYVLVGKKKKARKGDVVVFQERGGHQVFIKRLMGYPGDKVRISNDIVYVNEKKIPQREHQVDKKLPAKMLGRSYKMFIEKINEKEYPVFIDENKIDNPYTETEVYKDSFFVLGDNRNHSKDSREIGFIHKYQIVGRALWVFGGNFL